MPDTVAPSAEQITLYPITQATRATFTGLYFSQAVMFFIQSGCKSVICPIRGELIGKAGDVMVFPPEAVVTMEHQPVMAGNYQALGVSFPSTLVDQVFAQQPIRSGTPRIELLRAELHNPAQILSLLQDSLNTPDLPPELMRHRQIEPLIWLRAKGISLPTQVSQSPAARVRALIETDLTHGWSADEVAAHFAMSPATLRRWLAKSGQGFAKVLLNTRLEHGLTQLQTTQARVSDIALDCGFKTPSHFADSFRKRFGIRPTDIRSPVN
jgi:AraC-like DNA-binding protein